jgi:methionyl-tRNA formyltransferase
MKKKVIFFGNPSFAVTSLEKLTPNLLLIMLLQLPTNDLEEDEN